MLRLTRLALRHPRLWLAGTALVTALFAAGLPRLERRTEGAALHPRDNPVVRQTRADAEIFSDGDLILVLVEARGGLPVASPPGFALLRRLDAGLRHLPGIRGAGVRSLASLPEVVWAPPSLSAAPYLDRTAESGAPFAERLREIRRHPLVPGTLLSADGRAAALYVPLADTADTAGRRRALAEVERLLAAERGAPFSLKVTGPVVAETRLGETILADLARLVPLMVVALMVLFWLQLRTPGALVVVSAEVLCVLVWTLGAMGLSGTPLTLVTTLLPVLLMAVAITDEIHLLERFQGFLAAAGAQGEGEPERASPHALLQAMGELERPTVAAASTTALGFLAFPFTSIGPLQQFGLFSTLGLAFAVLLSFSTIPALIVLLPRRWFVPRSSAARGGAGEEPAALLPHEAFLTRRRTAGLVLGAAALLLALPCLPHLRVGDNWVANFDPGSEVVAAERAFNRSFWGTYRFGVVLTGPRGYFFRPEGVRTMAEVEALAARQPGVSGVASYRVPLAEIARAFGDGTDLSRLPRERVEDFLNLAAMSEDPRGLTAWVTGDGSRARAELFLQSEDYRRDSALRERLAAGLPALLRGRGVRHHLGGDIPVGLEMVRAIVVNQVRSIALTGLAAALLLWAVERSWRFVATAMLPVLAALLLVFAGMAVAAVPLGVATSLFGSLTIGIGIDFSLHFLHSYRQEAARHGEPERALEATFAKTGKALRWSVVVLALGFSVLAFSELRPDRSLGVLLAAAMIASYLMTLLWLPDLAVRLERRERSPRRPTSPAVAALP